MRFGWSPRWRGNCDDRRKGGLRHAEPTALPGDRHQRRSHGEDRPAPSTIHAGQDAAAVVLKTPEISREWILPAEYCGTLCGQGRRGHGRWMRYGQRPAIFSHLRQANSPPELVLSPEVGHVVGGEVVEHRVDEAHVEPRRSPIAEPREKHAESADVRRVHCARDLHQR